MTLEAVPPGAASDEDDADGNRRRESKELNEREGKRRHEDELEERAESNVLRMIEDVLEVAGRKAHAHSEHDDT